MLTWPLLLVDLLEGAPEKRGCPDKVWASKCRGGRQPEQRLMATHLAVPAKSLDGRPHWALLCSLWAPSARGSWSVLELCPLCGVGLASPLQISLGKLPMQNKPKMPASRWDSLFQLCLTGMRRLYLVTVYECKIACHSNHYFLCNDSTFFFPHSGLIDIDKFIIPKNK